LACSGQVVPVLQLLAKMIYWIVAAGVIVLAAVVAVANRAPVTLSFDPLPFAPTLPLYAVVFSSISIGLALGALVGAWSVARRRRAKRRAPDSARQIDNRADTDLAT